MQAAEPPVRVPVLALEAGMDAQRHPGGEGDPHRPLLGLTFATTGWLLYVASFAVGFFLISVAPIGMEYSAEVTQPTPEGTSQGVVRLVGQCSVVIVYLMAALKSGNGTYTTSLLFCVGLLVVGAVVVGRLHDPRAEPTPHHHPTADQSQPTPA